MKYYRASRNYCSSSPTQRNLYLRHIAQVLYHWHQITTVRSSQLPQIFQ